MSDKSDLQRNRENGPLKKKTEGKMDCDERNCGKMKNGERELGNTFKMMENGNWPIKVTHKSGRPS